MDYPTFRSFFLNEKALLKKIFNHSSLRKLIGLSNAIESNEIILDYSESNISVIDSYGEKLIAFPTDTLLKKTFSKIHFLFRILHEIDMFCNFTKIDLNFGLDKFLKYPQLNNGNTGWASPYTEHTAGKSFTDLWDDGYDGTRTDALEWHIQAADSSSNYQRLYRPLIIFPIGNNFFVQKQIASIEFRLQVENKGGLLTIDDGDLTYSSFDFKFLNKNNSEGNTRTTIPNYFSTIRTTPSLVNKVYYKIKSLSDRTNLKYFLNTEDFHSNIGYDDQLMISLMASQFLGSYINHVLEESYFVQFEPEEFRTSATIYYYDPAKNGIME